MDMMRLFETLRTQGYEGGYDAVRRHARRWQRAEAGQAATAFVPLSFDPGEAYQFDWSHKVVVLAGVTATVKVAHVRLCHSRMFFVAAYAPLGYDPRARTLVINQAEAVIVRHIFRRYVDLGSVYALREDLEREAFRSTVTMSRNGNTRGGQPFSRGSLFHMLRNRLYLGEIVHRDVTHPGLHPAVVDRDLFDQVQSMLERRGGHHRKRQASRAPLVGILVDALGNRIAATHSRGRGDRRYLYYISPVPASHPDASRVLRRVPATGIEEIMIERLRAWSGRRSAGWSDLVPVVFTGLPRVTPCRPRARIKRSRVQRAT